MREAGWIELAARGWGELESHERNVDGESIFELAGAEVGRTSSDGFSKSRHETFGSALNGQLGCTLTVLLKFMPILILHTSTPTSTNTQVEQISKSSFPMLDRSPTLRV